ncbi:PadR family transcriptional regulator [Williamsia sp. CHRR-6]|uniref:PadR family transcriptional regulator n=1 Tax=Williamsia sp. CHRR-6 TaxID=2835871 RepID=UPI001BDB1305|nr:PadR family transcriptional regulator [Williamsia sp. CHRR-6]MBT0568282.1 PadR family transcriptional regulator [Williamsia sp. CHRR-6]
MALEHAILVSLAERPGTGYEIGRQFDRSIGYFWSATHQQIYRTLKKLHDDGLVEFEAITQDSRPDKKVYTLSERGRDALRDWVSQPAPIPRLRDELSVKLRAARHGDLGDLITEIRRHRDLHAEQLRLYRSFAERDHPGGPPDSGRRLHQYLVLSGGIRTEQAFVDWLDEVTVALESERDQQFSTTPTERASS